MKLFNIYSVLLLLVSLYALAISNKASADHHARQPAGEEMREAAQQFLVALRPELRKQATFDFDGPERTDWHFIPKERTGVKLKDMSVAERRAAHRLMRSALSDRGYLKATTIMSLESVLRVVEAERENVEEIRDEEKYWFAVYGDPSGDKSWGWRVEGHHLSLNFTSHSSTVLATFPAFYGANPAEVRDGRKIGLRTLAKEEDLAHDLMASLNEDQTAKATFTDQVPADVITAPGGKIDLANPVGLPVKEMSAEQGDIVWNIITQLAGNMRDELADAALREILRAGVDNIYFAWAGEPRTDQRHYYRLHGPTFVIEYDKTDPNHIHVVWHSAKNDFGLDALKRHYQEAEHHSNSAKN